MSKRTSQELEALAQRLETWGDDVAPGELVLERLPDLVAVAEAADEATASTERLTAAVVRAREAGRGWGEIGRALGVSRQAARQRFSRFDPGPSLEQPVAIIESRRR